MKHIFLLFPAAAWLLSCQLHADQPAAAMDAAADAPPPLARPDAHAPFGVMFDHAHPAGGFMLGYRYLYTRDEGLLQGSDSISPSRVFETNKPTGTPYTAAPVEMDMHMHMLELMWAPADWITFMIMPMYMEMTMTMESQGAGHGHAAESHMAHGGGSTSTSTHSHSTAGWSDTSFSALIPFWSEGAHEALFILGVNVPTGSVDQTMANRYTHYMMQLGSGTWDLRPGFTYAGYQGNVSWGAQALGTLRLQEDNGSGYALGDALDLTAWTAYRLTDAISLSGRLAWRTEAEIDGHYVFPHSHNSPPDLQINYGGDRLDAGLGLNFIVPGGPLRGHRLAIEALTPVYQDANGIQLDRELSLFAGWQFAF